MVKPAFLRFFRLYQPDSALSNGTDNFPLAQRQEHV